MPRYFSAAKLNLFLHITGKRDDGYHNLQSIFCRLDFGDWLTISDNTDTNAPLVTLTGAKGLTKKPEDNLIIKAAYALQQYSQMYHIGSPKAMQIHLDKNLPTGAGLGGGSSNAATTLLALNQLWRLYLHTDDLIAIGKTLGADVPFFVANCSHAIAEGIGEILTPIDLPVYRYLVVCPPVHSSTPSFFADSRLNKKSPRLDHSTLLQDSDRYTAKLIAPYHNAFEVIAQDHIAIQAALDYLRSLVNTTQTTPRLTGTGSSVFLPIPAHLSTETLLQWQKNCPYPTFVAKNY